MQSIRIKNVIITSLLFGVVMYLTPTVVNHTGTGVVFASGSIGGSTGPTNDPISRRKQREATRLYNMGRKIFRKRIDCDDDGCLVGEDIIERSNAAEYVSKFNNDPQFTDVLEEAEIAALTAYLNERYRLRLD